MIYTKGQESIMPWVIEAADDGLTKDCVLVAKMNGGDMLSVSLYVATPAEKEE